MLDHYLKITCPRLARALSERAWKNWNLKIAVFALFIFLCANTASAATISKPPNNLGLVSYWSFDEGSGTIAHDFSGEGNNGTLINSPTWISGKKGKALSFSSSRVQYPNFADNLSNFTVSSWFKAVSGSSQPSCGGQIVSKLGAGGASIGNGWTLALGGGGCGVGANQVYAMIQSGGGSNWVTKYSNATYNDSNWHHAVMVVTGGNTVTLYIDGSSANTTSYTGGTISSYTNTQQVNVGADLINSPPGTYGEYFNGSVDDVRVYNRTLSAAEILSLYKSGGAKLSSTNSAMGTLSQGLVGWWTMDGKDTPWSSATAGTVIDKSGNGNTGTLTNMNISTSPIQGKIGQALNFDGVDDYVTIPNESAFDFERTDKFTISAWVYRTQNELEDEIFIKYSGGNFHGYGLFFTPSGTYTDQLAFSMIANDDSTFIGNTTNAVSINQWHHIVVTYDGSLTKAGSHIYVDGVDNPFFVGGQNDTLGSTMLNDSSPIIGKDTITPCCNFHGKMDDVRIYNRALSATEIQQLYGASVQKIATSDTGKGTLASGQVGYWTFNNKDLSWTSNTAFDRSGRGNNGTMINMSTTSSPVIGKVGQALKFNGVNSNVTVLGNSTLNDMTQKSVCAWIKPSASGHFVSKSDNVESVGSGWNFFLAGTTLRYYQGHCGGSDMDGYGPGVPLNTWSHVCFSHDHSSNSNPVYFYLNGVQSSSAGTGVSAVCGDTSYDIHIGSADAANDNPFPGLIDDVRIFNRIISASEAKQLYNSGR